MEIIRIEKQKRARQILYTDASLSFPLYEKEILALEIEEGSSLSEETWDRICEEILLPRAKSRALHILERMDRTEYQLRMKLREDHYPEEIAEAAVAYVKSYHYIDDLRYAQNFVRARQSSLSRLQLLRKLLERGISQETAQQAIFEEYTGSDAQLIDRYLEKKQYHSETADKKETARLYRSLCSRGFSPSEVRSRMELR